MFRPTTPTGADPWMVSPVVGIQKLPAVSDSTSVYMPNVEGVELHPLYVLVKIDPLALKAPFTTFPKNFKMPEPLQLMTLPVPEPFSSAVTKSRSFGSPRD